MLLASLRRFNMGQVYHYATTTNRMPIDFYYEISSPPCRAVLLTAAALDVKLNLITVHTLQKENLKPEFLKLNPQHTVPTMVDDGFILRESRTINRYLVNKYGGDSSLYPKDHKARAIVDQMLDFDLGTLYQKFAQYFYPQNFKGEPANEAAFKNLQVVLQYFNLFLEGNKYAAGSELTVADFSLVSSISTMEMTGISVTNYPNIAKWYELVKVTAPGYQEANQKGLEETKSLMMQYKAKFKK